MNELVDIIARDLKCNHEITKKFIDLTLQAIKRFDNKQDIYTTQNINEFGESGILFQINNKFKEIKKCLEVDQSRRNELMLTDEKIQKNYFDIAIFSLIAYLYKTGEWK
jgi:hypothetical protein